MTIPEPMANEIRSLIESDLATNPAAMALWLRDARSTAHAADADSPQESQGITAHAPLLAPDGPRLRAGCRRGAGLSDMDMHFQVCHDRGCPTCNKAHDRARS